MAKIVFGNEPSTCESWLPRAYKLAKLLTEPMSSEQLTKLATTVYNWPAYLTKNALAIGEGLYVRYANEKWHLTAFALDKLKRDENGIPGTRNSCDAKL